MKENIFKIGCYALWMLVTVLTICYPLFAAPLVATFWRVIIEMQGIISLLLLISDYENIKSVVLKLLGRNRDETE